MGAVLSVMVIAAIGLTILTGYYIYKIRGYVKAEYDKTNIVVTGKCTLPQDAIDISSKLCCVIGGVLSPLRYSSELDLVVSPQPVYPVNVCEGFCVNGIDLSSPKDAPNCLGFAGNDQFQKCLTRLKPQNCNGAAQPVGYDSLTLYYGYAAGSTLCATQAPCSRIVSLS